jgi:hypothetical protein
MPRPDYEIELTAIAMVRASRQQDIEGFQACIKGNDAIELLRIISYLCGMVVASNELIGDLLGKDFDHVFDTMTTLIIREVADNAKPETN